MLDITVWWVLQLRAERWCPLGHVNLVGALRHRKRILEGVKK